MPDNNIVKNQKNDTNNTSIDKDDVIAALQKQNSQEKNKKNHHPSLQTKETSDILYLTSQIATAYFQSNHVAPNDVASVIGTIYHCLNDIKNKTDINNLEKKSIINIDDSLTPDYIICLEDGKKLKMLKRHLRTNFNMSPNEYRAKWGLPPDYPMVAPNYANLRSQFAKKTGLGKTRKINKPTDHQMAHTPPQTDKKKE